MEPFDGVGDTRVSPLAERQPGEGECRSRASSRLLATALHLSRHFANEGAPALLDLGSGGRVDHVVIVGRNLLMQALADVGKQVAILVDGAALGLADGDRRTCRPRRRFS